MFFLTLFAKINIGGESVFPRHIPSLEHVWYEIFTIRTQILLHSMVLLILLHPHLTSPNASNQHNTTDIHHKQFNWGTMDSLNIIK